jgi:hypothetical protein
MSTDSANASNPGRVSRTGSVVLEEDEGEVDVSDVDFSAEVVAMVCSVEVVVDSGSVGVEPTVEEVDGAFDSEIKPHEARRIPPSPTTPKPRNDRRSKPVGWS